MNSYATRADLYSRKAESDDVGVAGGELRRWPIIVGYAGSILIGLVVPAAAVVLYLGLAVYMVLPLREIVSIRRQRRRWAEASDSHGAAQDGH